MQATRLYCGFAVVPGTIEETMDTINDYRDDGKQSVGARVLSVGINTVIAGAGDALFTAASKGLANVKKLVNGTIGDVKVKEVEGTAKARAEVEGAGKPDFITDPVEMKKYIIVPEDGFQAFLEKKYIEIRKLGVEDIGTVAKNTGLTEEQVIKMKKHLFLDTKQLSVGGKPYEQLYFQADQDIAYAWQLAQKGELNNEQKNWFRELANHELTEQKLMNEGMPLRDTSTWNGKGYDIKPEKNAHDKANLTDKQPKEDFPDYDKYKEYDQNNNNKIDY